MTGNYLRTAWRSLFKNKIYALINISGLAVSLTTSVLILLWVWDELSFDRMHPDADRIYTAAPFWGGTTFWNTTPAPLASYAVKDLSFIEAACRMSDVATDLIVQYGGKKFNETGVGYADSSFFTMFNFKLLEGNKRRVFSNNQSVVISRSVADKYFGNRKAVGEVLFLRNNNPFTVTGVMEDMPANSSIRFNIVLPFTIFTGIDNEKETARNWGGFNYRTYFLFKEGVTISDAEKQLKEVHLRHVSFDRGVIENMRYILHPLTRLHLYNADGSDKGYQTVRIFMTVAFAILLIACINYINLVTARASRRAREISVRKIIGASRRQLIRQFLCEAGLTAVLALVVALCLIALAMPFYGNVTGKEPGLAAADLRIALLLVTGLLLVIVAAGIYPALLLSSLQPVDAMKGIIKKVGYESGIRKVLVVVQFSCSVILIFSTVVITRQLNFLRDRKPGYEKEYVFTFSARNFEPHYQALKKELESQPAILGVTVSSAYQMQTGSSTNAIGWDGHPQETSDFVINQMTADANFLKVMGVPLVEGKGFSGTPADSAHLILNETAIREMKLKEPVGKKLFYQDIEGTVVGVVKDFHFKDMKTRIEPLIIWTGWKGEWNNMYVKTTAGRASEAIAAVEKYWKKYNADYEFDYTFLDDTFDQQYKTDIRTGILFNYFAGVAVFLSCLGLFGLVTFASEMRVREIGIRKVLGADISSIIVLLSKDYFRLIVVSFGIAFPFAWYLMAKWLSGYAYHTSVGWQTFVLSGIAGMAVAVFTVCGRALNAALSKPVDSIKAE